jgi:hypothetical protein
MQPGTKYRRRQFLGSEVLQRKEPREEKGMESWVGPIGGLDAVKKNKKCPSLLELEPQFLGHPGRSLVTIMSEVTAYRRSKLIH